jgi:hypothetical protein
VEEEVGAWRIYQLEGGIPLVAALRTVAGASTENQAKGTTKEVENGLPVASSAYRVVTWGLAMPQGEQVWSLYAFHAAGRGTVPFSLRENRDDPIPDFPLPPDCVKTFAMQVAGGATVSFQGPVQVETWKLFFDAWFREHRWAAAAGWQQNGPAWHCRWAKEGENRSAEAQFAPDGRGKLVGLLIMIDHESHE